MQGAHTMAKMTLAKYEKSPADRAAVAKINKGRK